MKKILLFALLALAVTVFLVSCNARVPTADQPDDGMEEPDKGNDFNKTVIHDVTFFDKEVTYDGREHSIFIEDELPYGVNVEYINNGQTNAGVYEITATLTSDDPEIIIEQSVHTATLTIKKKPIRDSIVFNDYTVEYNKYKRPVWFRIFKDVNRYYIAIFYDNEHNRAQGEDL